MVAAKGKTSAGRSGREPVLVDLALQRRAGLGQRLGTARNPLFQFVVGDHQGAVAVVIVDIEDPRPAEPPSPTPILARVSKPCLTPPILQDQFGAARRRRIGSSQQRRR